MELLIFWSTMVWEGVAVNRQVEVTKIRKTIGHFIVC